MTARNSSELDLDVLTDSIGVQVHLTRRALWLRVGRSSLRTDVRRPSGFLSSLITIGANPGVSQKRLADELFLDAGAIGDIVDMLQGEKLVERRRDPADRRRINLHLTEHGRAELVRARAMTIEQDNAARAKFTDDEVVLLLSMLKRLRT